MRTEELDDLNDELLDAEEIVDTAETGKYDRLIREGEKKYKISGMFKEWFLDYASYVILDRAVPHISDGLKPVQRRILHAMKKSDDGRYNKVANIVGSTMQYHPHGDASIKDALVQLGQKDLLIDCQGNWGNILTGDDAAAGRYIEARLSKFANEVVFNPKTTEWMSSYDGRNEEPVSLPIKFPLLLAQGTEGIAVGLASKILPHNFNELIDASIAYLKGEPFELYPDFPTGGLADVSRYNRGCRGGQVRIRSRIVKADKRTLIIKEIPFGKTTSILIESIIKANDKGKIKIRRIDDNTAEQAEIVITLPNDVSPDKTIDALYACTDCEVSISPNACVIMDKKPHFIGVDDILKHSTDLTLNLLKRELEIRLEELGNAWHYNSLEKIFFENKVYRILENDARNWEDQLQDVWKKMLEFQSMLRLPITLEDIQKLVEKPVRKISRFDVKAVTDKILGIEKEEDEIRKHLADIVNYTIAYFENLRKKYGARYPRRTELLSFENIEVTKVVASNVKLYVNKADGFIGTSPKKIENAEFVCDCADIDDIIIFLKDGRYIIKKIGEKVFVDKNILHVGIFNRTDTRTVYNIIYRDGKNGTYFAKRCAITGISRDKWYNLTKGTENSTIQWFSANPNGEAELLKIYLRPRPKLKKTNLEFNFADLAIKNRGSMGNIVSKNPIQKIHLKSAGVSTIGGKPIWFDWDILRLNEDGRGELLGEITGQEHIFVLCEDGTFYTTSTDLSSRYQGNIKKICIFDPEQIYTALYWDGEAQCYYLKRFQAEVSDNQVQLFIAEAKGSYLVALSEDLYPQVEVHYIQNGRRPKETERIDVEEFIAVKGFKAKGKRITTHPVEQISFIEPLEKEPVCEPIPEQEDEITVEEDFQPGEIIDLTLF
ncbi:MAG: DNA gyrase/topoisomerase IV subunit A [Bacteroidales bacterium]|nr:DNA gyrase/topoisomerase IV subunit A [Bacteroidales bacterium]